MGCFVIGRNGISFQWKARVLDRVGFASKIDVDEENPAILTPPVGHAVKNEGANMAVRRSVLVDLEGFDPAYHFYLDDRFAHALGSRQSFDGYRAASSSAPWICLKYPPSWRPCVQRPV